MTPPNASPNEAWPEAMATVLSCSYEAGAGRALAFGVPTTKHFRITFNYWANGELHTDTFSSEKAVPQGTLFPITYNPDVPNQHSHSETSISRNPLLMVGIIGSVILTTAWFFVLRGCR